MPWWLDAKVWDSNLFNNTKEGEIWGCTVARWSTEILTIFIFFLAIFPLYWRYIADFFGNFFCKISLIWFFFKKYRVAHSQYTIYRRYIVTFSSLFPINDENIGNYGYIGISILQIYYIYQRNIDEYFDIKYRWKKN